MITIIRYNHINYLQNSARSWVLLEHTFSQDFYKTREAQRIGENVLYFQTKYGGWGKDICMQYHLSFLDKFLFKYKRELWYSTIDNDATVTEIDYLSKLFNTTQNSKYKDSVLKGIEYLLSIQYSNGGFPQKAPDYNVSYQQQITYNDEAMINVMKLFKKIIDNDDQYSFVDYQTRQQIRDAFNKGLDCILKTQLSSGMWAAQYDRETLKPCYGRKFEPPSIDTRESASIVVFLMDISNPSDKVSKAIKKSASWYKKHAIYNKTVNIYRKWNKLYVKLDYCVDCNPIWARLYDIDKDVPIFSDKTQNIKFDLSEISNERILGYEWYVYSGNTVLDNYKNWEQKYRY